ncbi:MAG: MBL fold metallo-hydrolase [Candidatus Glassbacteria bacterium]|nr:MBL fold metallo-hydrolase [Candidatus Glassbacteria bacterium]
MLKTYKLPVGLLGSNCYLAWDPDNRQAVVIDPGAEPERIIRAAAERDLEVHYIINTHGHGDHIGGNRELKVAYPVPLLVHQADAPMLEDARLNMSSFFGEPVLSPPADGFLVPGEKVRFGRVALTVLHTPGHTPGGVSLYGEGAVFTGDALFCGSIGRCDMPYSDELLQLESIRKQLLTLPDETLVLPGHGQSTTIGQEKKWNPFFVSTGTA